MGFSSALKQSLLSIDILSYSPGLKINKRSIYQTLMGGLSSVLLFAISLTGIVYFGRELYLKNEPIAIVSAKEYDDVGPFEMNEKKFATYIAMEHKNYTFYNDPTIFNLTANNQVITLDSQGKQVIFNKDLIIKTCRELYPNDDLYAETMKIDLDIYYCLKPNQATIEGFWGAPKNSFVQIILSKCVNSTDNNNHCQDPDYIDDILQGGVITMLTENYNLELNSYETPAARTFSDIFYSLNIEFTFTLYIQLRPLELLSDNGLIFPEIQQISTSYFDDPKVLYYGKRDSIVADIVIQAKPLGKRINRSYTKFQDVLTKVGGLIKAITVVLSFFVNHTSYIEFFNDFIFNLQTRAEETKKIEKYGLPKGMNFLKKKLVNAEEDKSNQHIQTKMDEDKLNSDLSAPDKQISSTVTNNNLYGRNPKGLVMLDPKHTQLGKQGNPQKANTNLSFKNTGSNYLFLEESNKLYESCQAFKDYISQVLPCNKTLPLKLAKKALSDKIDHALSLETLLEKIYFVEILTNINLTEDQIGLLNKDYLSSIQEGEKSNKDQVFSIKKNLTNLTINNNK